MNFEHFIMSSIGDVEFKKSRGKQNKFLIIALVFFILTTLGLLVALLLNIFLVANPDLPEKELFCMSEDCTVAAATMLQSMDRSYKPCEDFYSFACGGFIQKNPIPDDSLGTDVFERHSMQILHQIRDLLENSDPHAVPLAVVKAQFAYIVCMNSTGNTIGGLEELKSFLTKIGGWPLIEGRSWTGVPVVQVMAAIEKNGFSNQLVTIALSPDMKDTDKWRITLDQPDSSNLRTKTLLRRRKRENDIPTPKKKKKKHDGGDDDDEEDDEEEEDQDAEELAARTELLRDLALLFGNNNTKVVNSDIEDMFRFEKDLQQIQTPRDERRNYTRMYNKVSVRELQYNITNNKVNWTTLLKYIFTNVTEIEDNEEIIVAELDYMKKLPKVLSNHSRRTIVNYIIWENIYSLLEQIDLRISALYYEYLARMDRLRQPKPRWKVCLEATNDMFGFSLSRLFVEKLIDSEAKTTAERFVRFLQAAYKDNIRLNKWMDLQTKKMALAKVDSMKGFIGYPDWILDDDKLNAYYKPMRLSYNHLKNVINDRINSTHRILSEYRKPVDKDKWTEIPTAVNAYYEGQSNSIWFPAGILKAPFFDMDRPAYMNFGTMGAIIGHEIGHGFDDEGGQFDDRGRLRQWWTMKSFEKFVDRAQCFVDQFNQYCPEEYKLYEGVDNDTCLNGINTLGENMADSSGLVCAHKAYKYWVEDHGKDLKLPGLEEYSSEQIFFISFAQIWCENNRQDQLKNIYEDDPHSPGKYRVQGTLANFPEFSKAFQCSRGTMNRGRDSCSLW